MTISADSSFLISYYLEDVHSSEADRRMHTAGSVSITPLNRTEFAHAIHQYVFRGTITPQEAQEAWQDFEDDCSNRVWNSIDLPESVWETSIDLARRYGSKLGVRTLDSLHVACALELKARKFWTFDERQLRLAQAAGLDTDS